MLSGEFAESEPKDFSEPIDEGDQAEDYGYYSDSDLEDDCDVVDVGKTLGKTPLRSSSPRPLRSSTNTKKAGSDGEWKEPSWKGAVIKIHDIAVITCVPRNGGHHIANAFADFRLF